MVRTAAQPCGMHGLVLTFAHMPYNNTRAESSGIAPALASTISHLERSWSRFWHQSLAPNFTPHKVKRFREERLSRVTTELMAATTQDRERLRHLGSIGDRGRFNEPHRRTSGIRP